MYFNLAFRLKMAFLIPAILFTFTLYRKATFSEGTSISPLRLKLVALLSLLLWSSVALGGRAIGYTRQVRSETRIETRPAVPSAIVPNTPASPMETNLPASGQQTM